MIGMRRATIWALFASVLALCNPTAEAKGIYLGGSLGQGEARDLGLDSITDGSVLTGSTDGTDNGWKLFAGFKVSKIVNAEIGYLDYGQASFSATSDGTGTIYAAGPLDGLADTTAVSVSAMVVLPVGRFKFFAKGGVARWRTELKTKFESDRFQEMSHVAINQNGTPAGVAATKWLADRYSSKGTSAKRGRPSTAEKTALLREESEEDKLVSEEAERLGLVD